MKRRYDVYKMSHKNRGDALIFNQEYFETLDRRRGTNVDCEKLRQTLEGLHFDVKIYKDYWHTAIRSVLEEFSRKEHTENDCILIAILSHGEPGNAYAYDHEYSVDSLTSFFTADKCPSLAGKPKLFIIQTCRGDRIDLGAFYQPQSASGTPLHVSTTIPVQADFLCVYSTVSEYVSYRHPIHGSWYVQTLCEQLRINGTRYDLMNLLIIVNRKVAELDIPINGIFTVKQMPFFTSSLTKSLSFKKNNVAFTKGSFSSLFFTILEYTYYKITKSKLFHKMVLKICK